MARALVPFFWMICSATAGRQDSLTVPTMELASITAYTVKMLVSDVNVSLYYSYKNISILKIQILQQYNNEL